MTMLRTLRVELTDTSGDIDPLDGNDMRLLLREFAKAVGRHFEMLEVTDIEEMDRECVAENPREKGDDDGREYADPRGFREGLE